MIVQEIKPHKETYTRSYSSPRSYGGHGQHPWEQFQRDREREWEREMDKDDSISEEAKSRLHAVIAIPNPQSTKAYYAEWLKTVPFTRGKYVTSKTTVWPYREGEIFRVVQLQEVHHFVKWDDEGNPIVMELANALGTRFWTNLVHWKLDIVPRPDLQFETPSE